MKLLTYNIDGLNPSLLTIRIQFILSIILSQDADVIQLQEIIPEIYSPIRKVMESNGYVCSEPMMQSYFVMSCVKKQYQGSNLRFEIIPFTDCKSKSDQGRYLLKTSFLAPSAESNPKLTYCFLNAHLESCGIAFKSPSSFTRMAQLQAGLEQLLQSSNTTLSVLAGDLNIRDAEATQVLKSFETRGIHDIIEQLYNETEENHAGANKRKIDEGKEDTWNTWYLPDKQNVRYRFDRVYGNSAIKGSEYHLIGGEEVLAEFVDGSESCAYLTPSDHRGIVVNLHELQSPPSSSASHSVKTSHSLSQSLLSNQVIRDSRAPDPSVFPNFPEKPACNSSNPPIVASQSTETEEEKKKRIREQRIRVLGGGGGGIVAQLPFQDIPKASSNETSERERISKKPKVETTTMTDRKAIVIDLT
jgi:exonuclease III